MTTTTWPGRPWVVLRRAQLVPLAYAGIVAATTVWVSRMPGSRRTAMILAVSTDPYRLYQHPVRSLLLSPFVVQGLPGLWLLPGTVLALGRVQQVIGARATIITGVLGHAAVSLTVAMLLERDDPTPEAIDSADVGVSYVLAIAAGLASMQAPTRWAATAAGLGTTLTGALLLLGRTSTDAGHLLAWLLGLALGARIRRPLRQRPPGRPVEPG